MAVNQFVEISPEIHKNLSGIAISVRINYDWNTYDSAMYLLSFRVIEC